MTDLAEEIVAALPPGISEQGAIDAIMGIIRNHPRSPSVLIVNLIAVVAAFAVTADGNLRKEARRRERNEENDRLAREGKRMKERTPL